MVKLDQMDKFPVPLNWSDKFFSLPEFGSHRIPWVVGTVLGLYAFFSIIGTLANITVIVVLLAHKTMNNITNIFVLVLAISDIVLLSFSMPLQTYYTMTETTHLTTSICRVLFALYGLPMYVSCLTILLIAIDRYRMIITPLKPRITRNGALAQILFIIIVSIINSIPVAVVTLTLRQGPKNVYCVEDWKGRTHRLVYSVFIYVLQFLLPLLITALLYFRIYWRLRERSSKKIETKRKRKTNRILISIVTCFAICWSPWMTFSLILEVGAYFLPDNSVDTYLSTAKSLNISFNNSVSVNGTNGTFGIPSDLLFQDFKQGAKITQIHRTLIDNLLKVLTLTSGCINPFLYGWLNDSIRAEMIRLFNKLRGRKVNTEKNLAAVNTAAPTELNTFINATCDHKNGNMNLLAKDSPVIELKQSNKHLDIPPNTLLLAPPTPTTLVPPSHMAIDNGSANQSMAIVHNVDEDRPSAEGPSLTSIEWADLIGDREEIWLNNHQNEASYNNSHYSDSGQPRIPLSAKTICLSDRVMLV